MTHQRYFRIGVALFLLAGIASVLFFRNTPPDAAFERPSVLPAPDAEPSKANVHASYARQVEQLKRSVEQDPKNAPHRIALAQLLMDGHNIQEAIHYFEQAAVLQPDNDSLLLDLAVCYSNAGRPDRAMEVTDRILKNDARHPRALYNKGALLASAGRKQEAVTVWKRLIAAAPESEQARTVRGYLSALENQ